MAKHQSMKNFHPRLDTSLFRFSGFILFALILSCSGTKDLVSKDDGHIEVVILQMNDVYEIAGIDAGRSGGLSRVAYYYKELQKKYPQSLLMIAGDFLNPSLIGTMKVDGERVKGRQMVEVLNAMGVDLAAFGNHEFDLSEDDLQRRINESTFDWIATNIYQVCGSRTYPFYKDVNGRKQFIPESKVYNFTDADGTSMDLGVFSSTIDSNPIDYVSYHNADSCATLEINRLEESADVIIGLTHLTIDEDLALAAAHPNVTLIMGGHEHDNMFHKVGKTTVAKADANARTVYVHVIGYNTKTGKKNINSDLIEINEQIPKDPEVDKLVQKWKNILESNFKQILPEPYEVIYHADPPLDGRESTLRHRPANMGQLFTEAMMKASKSGSVAAIMNAGSIRIDDEMSGDIAAIDIFRALPFGGSIVEVTVTGNLLFGILRFSENAKGSGAYLQYSGLEKKGDDWLVAGKPLDRETTYTIALTDFLIKGYDIPFLTEENTGISKIYKPQKEDQADLRNDIRLAIIDYLKTK